MFFKTQIFVFVFLPITILIIAKFRQNIHSTFGFLLFTFWIPIGLFSAALYVFEFCIYVISFLIIMRFPREGNEQPSDDSRIKSFLSDFPWFLLILYIIGALLTWLFSKTIIGEINKIRIQCLLPLALSLVIFVSVRSREDAERILWWLLTSAGILAVLFLVGRYFISYISETGYAASSGRLSMQIILPHYLGFMDMLPQRTSCFYAYLLMYAYSLWTFQHSFFRRMYALCLCFIFGCIIITTQGRGGAIAAAIGVIIISVYAAFSKRVFELRGIWLKCTLMFLVVIGGIWYTANQSSNEEFRQHGMAMFSETFDDENVVGRFDRISSAIKLYKENPILGIGLRGYETPWGGDTSEVLNVFLFTILSFGLLGFISFMLVLRKFVIAFIQGIRSQDLTSRTLCIASICGLLGCFLGLHAIEPYGIVIFWTPLVLAFSVVKLKKDSADCKPQFDNVMIKIPHRRIII
jgi:hypothetical protein